MLTKNIIGIAILVCNTAGLGYLLFLGIQALIQGPSHSEQAQESQPTPEKKEPAINNDQIIPDEEDLLKDIDLSDLDDLNLEDFD